jgi:hypothetical protein
MNFQPIRFFLRKCRENYLEVGKSPQWRSPGSREPKEGKPWIARISRIESRIIRKEPVKFWGDLRDQNGEIETHTHPLIRTAND